MRIGAHYSHLNGFEGLYFHGRPLWDEIRAVVDAVQPCVYRASGSRVRLSMESRFLTLGWARRHATFIKERVALKVHFERPLVGAWDLVAEHLSLFVGDVIDVGIEILPMKALQNQMSSGVAYYEGELYNLIRGGRGVPAVPLIVIGVTP